MQPPMGMFLPGSAGNLFAMYYPPAENEVDLGDVLYVHPFAGEMPASRNVIAALARTLAGTGLGVLTVDLYGCGDSSGDFSDARWEIWRDDLTAAVEWLRAQGRDRLSLWGLRLGALLAMDFAVRSQETYEKIILWQPVVTGRDMLTQFFRMNLDEADRGFSPGELTNPEARNSSRGQAGNQNVDIAGYELSWDLIHSIDKLEIAPLGKAVSGSIQWIEFGEKTGGPLHTDSLRVIQEWKQQGVRVTTHKSASAPFWLFPHCSDPQGLTGEVKAAFTDVSQ